jgi:hypothetical protein
VEEYNGKLSGFEFKYNFQKIKFSAPAAWKAAYPKATYKVISKGNFEEFVLK